MASSAEQQSISLLRQHLVQFYETDDSLLMALTTFIATGLRACDACVVIATGEHHQALSERLEASGQDLQTAREQADYSQVDAAETLSQIMVADMPDPQRFFSVVGGMIEQAQQQHSHVRVFGEMATLLWFQGQHAAALRLEELGNELQRRYAATTIFCGYPLHLFEGNIVGSDFLKVCQQHSHVIPLNDGSFFSDRLLPLETITLFQPQGGRFEVELAQRKEIERLLRLSKEDHPLLAAIVESSNDAIVSKTLDGIITSWNKAAEHLFGYTAQEAIGQHITMIIPLELRQEEEEIIARMRQGIPIRHFETVRVRSDGRRIDVSLSISPVRDASGRVIGAAKIARDISERKELDRRKDEFIGMASHELKTPITSLKGFTQLLQRRLKNSSDAETLHFLERMDGQINKLTKLIYDMLDLSRIQNGELEYRMNRFDLAELVREVVADVQATTQTHQILLEQPADAQIYGDRDRLGQVLVNLLVNAIKYSRDMPRVLVHLSIQPGEALVSVQDFGIGIAEEYQEKIFDQFYQVSEPAEKTYPGLGIGLYIARKIVERHRGRLLVESRKGEGSTFSFRLPLAHS